LLKSIFGDGGLQNLILDIGPDSSLDDGHAGGYARRLTAIMPVSTLAQRNGHNFKCQA
jgi:hypothetical protein